MLVILIEFKFGNSCDFDQFWKSKTFFIIFHICYVYNSSHVDGNVACPFLSLGFSLSKKRVMLCFWPDTALKTAFKVTSYCSKVKVFVCILKDS